MSFFAYYVVLIYVFIVEINNILYSNIYYFLGGVIVGIKYLSKYKDDFNDCKNYISIYKDLIVTIGVYIDYLEKKSDAGVAIETTYSAG